jgi:hypothetical protein
MLLKGYFQIMNYLFIFIIIIIIFIIIIIIIIIEQAFNLNLFVISK